MIKAGRFHRLFIAISLLSISLNSAAYAVDFDARDTRIDLPVLSTPNNAITPDISTDQTGHIYVVWSDNRGGTSSIYANSFLPNKGWQKFAAPINSGFPSPTGEATSPKVCSDNSGHVYVVWVDDRAVKAGTGGRDIYFKYSKDYGQTWYPEFTDERLDSDTPKTGDSINPQIACGKNGNVYVVWEDDRNRAGTYEVYFRSLQVQFKPMGSPVDTIVPYQYPDVRLNTGVDAARFSARYPVISTDKKEYVYVAWQDSRNIPEENIYNGIYFNGSQKHGATWQPEATRIDRAPIGYYQALSPAISSDSNGYVYVAWLDNAGRSGPRWEEKYAGDGTYDVYVNRSRNYGVSWDENEKRIDMPSERIEARHVDIASNNKGVVSIVWSSNLESKEKGLTTNFNIYYNHSEDYGRSFLESEPNIRIDTGVAPGISTAYFPKVRVDDFGNIFTAWLDTRSEFGGTYDIYFNFSVEKGRKDTWQVSDIRLDYPIPPGDSLNHAMSIDNLGHVHVVWQDTKSALAKDNYNIYFISGFLDIEAILISGQRLAEACFIATAAYGSPFEPHVELLREFRDRYLLTNVTGRRFVSLYYRLSPPVARFITEHDYLKPAVRTALLPVVGIAMLALHTTPLQKVAMVFIMIMLLGSASFIIAKRKK